MSTLVRSYSKVNLGLAIGRPRPDGFHELCTLYQTLALHDLVQVSARAAGATHIELTCSDTRVPVDGRNTAWKMVERALERLGMAAEVTVHIRKSLPVQGGMGAGSANAAAALLGLLRELGVEMPLEDRLAVAAEVGSDVPLFLVGGSVLGEDRGQRVRGVADVRLAGDGLIPCVVALPKVGVSTPLAFREWDQRFEGGGLQSGPICDTLEKLSRTYASMFLNGSPQGQSGNEQDREQQNKGSGATGIFHEPMPAARQAGPEKQQGIPDEQRQAGEGRTGGGTEKDLAENSLLALVQTGIENDFETVVFPQYPPLGEIKRQLMGSVSGEGNALYAALSGSGSALFGLYRSMADAHAAQQRLQQHGVKAIVTSTMPRPLYWSNMFAE